MKRLKLNSMSIIELLDGVRHAGRQLPGGIRQTVGLTRKICRHRQMGLTLMELLIVVAIIGILSGTAIPFYFGQVEKARNIKAIAELEKLQLEIANFALNHNRLPDTLKELRSTDQNDPWGSAYRYLNFAAIEEDSEAAEESPEPDKRGKGKAIGKDKKSSIEAADARRLDLYNTPLNTDYDLYSCGKDGKSAASITDQQSEDDIVRGHDGGYIGRASDYEP